ncbi:MAG TPA: hypothetical protein VMT94_04825 [Burkholderiales bacterium]|nr:hypothetical protein [Burkholderiales bacterium]
MKSEIETVIKPSAIVVFGILSVLTGTLAALVMAAWGFTIYLA